ncbi:MAG: helix-turn-helix domain-containing protein [Candidatus Eremiobacteraeota bacterium]|nr:helix-turn-helix domain-containing protein [Candidatus Eremiobacteraeota bacterium]
MPLLGDEFRAAREARRLSLSDVAEQIHIRATYLEAIEGEDWAAIGAPVYVRGFIRTYARFLGIDPERAVEVFNQAVPSPPPTKQYGISAAAGAAPSRGKGPSIRVWLAAALALALVAYVGYGYYQLKAGAPHVAVTSAPLGATATDVPGASPLPASVASPEAPTPTEEPSTPSPSATRQAVSLRFTQVSWLRATVDGNVVLEGEFPAGTVRDFHGKHIHLLVGNAGGVEVTTPNAAPKLMGAPGEVVERDYVLRK